MQPFVDADPTQLRNPGDHLDLRSRFLQESRRLERTLSSADNRDTLLGEFS
jgi:hypothetical protein